MLRDQRDHCKPSELNTLDVPTMLTVPQSSLPATIDNLDTSMRLASFFAFLFTSHVLLVECWRPGRWASWRRRQCRYFRGGHSGYSYSRPTLTDKHAPALVHDERGRCESSVQDARHNDTAENVFVCDQLVLNTATYRGDSPFPLACSSAVFNTSTTVLAQWSRGFAKACGDVDTVTFANLATSIRQHVIIDAAYHLARPVSWRARTSSRSKPGMIWLGT